MPWCHPHHDCPRSPFFFIAIRPTRALDLHPCQPFLPLLLWITTGMLPQDMDGDPPQAPR